MKKTITLFCVFFCLLFTVKSQTTLTTAVDFTATDVHGNSLTLFDILDKGQYVLIDFFFTTCGPCQSATPSIVSMHNRFGCNEKDVFFIGVSPIDDDEDCHIWDETYGITYPTIGSDGGGSSICDSYNIGAYPTVILIAPDRTIIEQDIWPVSGLASIFTTLGLEEFNCNTSCKISCSC